MFRDNISKIIKEQNVNYTIVAERIGYEKKSARQLLSKNLKVNFWPLDRLEKLFSSIFDTPVKLGWKVNETGEIFYTEKMRDVVAAPWAELNMAELSSAIGVTPNTMRRKIEYNMFRKDDAIRTAGAVGIQMLMCDENGKVLYAFDESDLSDKMYAASQDS